MTVQCPACRSTLRIKSERIGNRSSARCPRCRANVPLRDARDESTRRRVSVTIQCDGCGARLRAPESARRRKSRCPKCRSIIVIEPPAAAADAPEERPEFEDSSTVATQRIDSRSLGLGTAPDRPPTSGAGSDPARHHGMDIDEFLGGETPPTPETVPEASRESSAGSLLAPDIGPMKNAAEEIRQAAEAIATPPPATGTPEPAPREAVEPHAVPDVPPVNETPAVQERETPARPTTAARPARRGTDALPEPEPGSRLLGALLGTIHGAIAGSLVIGGWIAARTRFGSAAVEPLLAPVPAWADRVPVTPAMVPLILTVLAGALVGLMASLTSRPTGRLGIISAFIWAMAVGAVTGASWVLTAEPQPGADFVGPGLNWVRDMMLVSLLAWLTSRLFAPSR